MNKNLSPALEILLMALICCIVAGFLFRSDGGINLDTLVYVRNSISFPSVESNIFPPGYSILIKSFNVILKDNFWSTKAINFFFLALILGFSWVKNFYFKETILVLCTKIGVGLWSFSYSEPMFISILFFQYYMLAQYFEKDKVSDLWPILMTILVFGLLLTRHSGIFIYAGYWFAFVFLFRKKGTVILKESYFKFLMYSAFLILAYLGYNYLTFNSFFGENLRGAPDITTDAERLKHAFLNLKGAISTWNPFYTLVLQHNENPAYFPIEMGIFSLDVVFAIGLIWGILKMTKSEESDLPIVMAITGLVFVFLMLFSSFQAGIEILNNRLLSPGSFCFLFPFIIYFLKKYPQKGQVFIGLGFISLGFNLFILLKTPANYLEIREKSKNFLELHSESKYFYVDKDEIPETKYTIPFLGKEFRYTHEVLKKSYINLHALSILKPEIQEIQEIKPKMKKSEFILNSEL